MNNNKRQQGMTLVELMVALLVSMVLVAGIGTVYISSKHNYQTRDQLSELDENARVALEALKRHLEHAGYASNGLFPLPHPFVLATPSQENCADGSNSIRTRSSLYLTQDGAVPEPPANVQGDGVGIAFLADDNLFRDCANAIVAPECRQNQAPSTRASLVYNTFSLDQPGSPRTNSIGDVIPSLYCSGSVNANRTLIAEGIENIQIMYGLDLDNNGAVDQYASAADVAADEWGNVISIKIALLVRSIEPVLAAAEAHSYTLLEGVVINTDDRYQRAVFTTVIQLRNMV